MTAAETAGAEFPEPLDLRARLAAVAVPRDVVRVAGPDALTYLQGQLSQDVVDDFDVGATTWSFVLQPTGKVDSWARVTRTAGDEVLLDVDGGHGEALIARLRRFLLRTKAEVDPLDWACVAVRGPGAAAAARDAAAEANAAIAVPAGWPGVDGGDLLGPDVRQPVGLPGADLEAYESLRIRSGVPALGAELTEKTIPAEAGQWLIDASVSFTKGCFTGQELVARIDSRGGNVPRRLHGLVVGEGERPPAAAPVVVDGAEVGRVTSAARAPGGGAVALAYVGRGVTPPAAVEIATPAGRTPAALVELPIAD
ncbi:MAG TPA: glycine cleavage T C-terminal barrel domain-containing protein [Acidimicrobiales bacterium]